jgi:hypothetical protein
MLPLFHQIGLFRGTGNCDRVRSSRSLGSNFYNLVSTFLYQIQTVQTPRKRHCLALLKAVGEETNRTAK